MIEAAAPLAMGDAISGATLSGRTGLYALIIVVGIAALAARWIIRARRRDAARAAHIEYLRGTGRYSQASGVRGAHGMAGEHVRRAGELHEAGDHRRALAEMGRAVALEPRSADLRLMVGAELHAMGRYAEAAEAFGEAISLDPGEPAALAGLGITLRHLGRHADSLGAFGRAVSIEPDNADSHIGMGRALLELGRHAEAAEAFGRAAELRPGDEEARAWSERARTAGGSPRNGPVR